jgi:hypothetical protein
MPLVSGQCVVVWFLSCFAVRTSWSSPRWRSPPTTPLHVVLRVMVSGHVTPNQRFDIAHSEGGRTGMPSERLAKRIYNTGLLVTYLCGSRRQPPRGPRWPCRPKQHPSRQLSHGNGMRQHLQTHRSSFWSGCDEIWRVQTHSMLVDRHICVRQEIENRLYCTTRRITGAIAFIARAKFVKIQTRTRGEGSRMVLSKSM